MNINTPNLRKPKKVINGLLVNVRRTQRNDPCPCGQTMVINYAKESGLPPKEVPVKFKNCCFNERIYTE